MNNIVEHTVKHYNSGNKIEEHKKDEIIQLYRDVFSADPWNYSSSVLGTKEISRELDFLTSDERGMIITVEKEEKVIGFRFVVKMEEVVANSDSKLKPLFDWLINVMDTFPEKISFTQNLGVSQEYRGNGVSSILIEEHLKYAVESGCNYVLGWTSPKNDAMIRSYIKNGYSQITNLPENLRYGIDFGYVDGKPLFFRDDHIDDAVFYLKDLTRK